MGKRGAVTPTSLPEGITMDYYDSPEEFRKGGRGVDPSPEVRKASEQLIMCGDILTSFEVPPHTNKTAFMGSIRNYLARRGISVKLAEDGNIIYGKLRRE